MVTLGQKTENSFGRLVEIRCYSDTMKDHEAYTRMINLHRLLELGALVAAALQERSRTWK